MCVYLFLYEILSLRLCEFLQEAQEFLQVHRCPCNHEVPTGKQGSAISHFRSERMLSHGSLLFTVIKR